MSPPVIGGRLLKAPSFVVVCSLKKIKKQFFYVRVEYFLALIGVFLPIFFASISVAPATADSTSIPGPAILSSIKTSTDLENRKLNLEIQKLEQDTGTAASIRAWLPAGSALIALTAASFGAYQYFNDKRREKEIRLQEQFSANMQIVADYVREENISSARLLAALMTLREISDLSNSTNDSVGDVTRIIVTSVTHDADFEDPLQVRFDLLCLRHWKDYKSWLNKHYKEHMFILYRYIQALRMLAKKHPQYFSQMKYEGATIAVPFYIDERVFLHFQQLGIGYKNHLRILAPEDRVSPTRNFGEALGNAAVAEQFLADLDTQENTS